MIKQHTIEAIADIPVSNIVGRYISLRKGGQDHDGLCPFHKDKSMGSFKVSDQKGYYHCFSCGAHGDGIKFVMDHMGLTFPEAVKEIAQHSGLQVEVEEHRNGYNKEEWAALEQMFTMLSIAQSKFLAARDKASDYLNTRKFSREILDTFGIGYQDGNLFTGNAEYDQSIVQSVGLSRNYEDRWYDVFKGRLTFPFHDKTGRIIGFAGRIIQEQSPEKKKAKYINTATTKIYQKSDYVYGFYQARRAIKAADQVFIVEGYFDCIRMHERGLANCVALSGLAFTEGQITQLAFLTKNFVLMLDMDKAGTTFTGKYIEILLRRGINLKVCVIPYTKGKDVDEFALTLKTHIDHETGDVVEEKLEDAIKPFITDWLTYLQVQHEAGGNDEYADAEFINQVAKLLGYIEDEVLRDILMGKFGKKYKGIKKAFAKIQKNNAPQESKSEWEKDVIEEFGLPEDADPNSFLQYGFFESQNRYYVRIKGENNWRQVSNFTMKVLFLIRSKTAPRRIVEITNDTGQRSVIDIHPENLVSLSKFQTIVETEGNFIFYGSAIDLTKIKRKLFDNEMNAAHIHVPGWQERGGFWAWSNGIVRMVSDQGGETPISLFQPVDDYGMIQVESRSYFLPTFSSIYKDQDDTFENERKFIRIESDTKFKDWAHQLVKVYGDNGKIGILFLLSNLFGDIVFKKTGFFPILYLFGPPKMGKSTFAKSLLSLYGEAQDMTAIEGDSTPKGILRGFAQYRNGLVGIDEYKNNINPRLIGMLKSLYNRMGYKRAKMTQDAQTETIPVLSGCVLAGQDMPTQDAALFTRTILLQFDGKHFAPDEYIKLQKMEGNGISQMVDELLVCRPEIKLRFKEMYDSAFSALKNAPALTGCSDRLLKNMAVLVAVGNICSGYIDLPFSFDLHEGQPLDPAFWQMLFNNLITQHRLMKGSNEVYEFWATVDYLVQTGVVVEEIDYKIVSSTELRIYLQKIHPAYVETMRRQGKTPLTSKDTLIEYLRVEGHIMETKSVLRINGQVTSGVIVAYDKIGVTLKKLTHESPIPGASNDAEKNVPF